MHHLVGNFWLHDDGTGQVSLYERIGRRYLPIRVESEGLPMRLPFEVRQDLEARIAEALKIAQDRTPTDVKLDALEGALQAFPGYEKMTAEDREALKLVLVGNNPEVLRPVPPDPPALPKHETVESQVERINREKIAQLNLLAQKDTEILRLQERLAALENNGQKEEVPQGQDAGGSQGLLGQEASRQDTTEG